MGIEAEQLLAGTAGKGVAGGKRLVGGLTGQTGKGKTTDLIKKFSLGAGSWGDDVLSNLSQPDDVDVFTEEHDSDSKLIERLRKEMKQSAERLDFENAARLRDRIFQLENSNLN